jgi:Reverse transcriptase (RNA-dependent DNA polymerase)
MFKIFNEDNLSLLIDFFNKIYDTGEIPEDWLTSVFIPIPKKKNAKKCEEHRIISFMSHALKILLNIIHSRIYKKLEEGISETQFGFRNGLGTREALFGIQVLIQRARDVNKDVYTCFIGFEKAFDKVRHQKLLETLGNTGIDSKDVRLIRNLYEEQQATVRLGQDTSTKIRIRKGVRQGCILSPILFNAYSERLFAEALHNTTDGVSINGEIINNMRYADDTVLLADSAEGLQRLIDRVVSACDNFGMKLNCKKTQILVISKNNIPRIPFYANNTALRHAERISYLGCDLNSNWDHSQEVRTRIEKARSTFSSMRKILCNMNLNIQIRTRVLRCYVFSVLLYGAEAWTLTEASIKRLQAFEMWCYRRMMRVSYIHHVTNQTILDRIQKECEIIRTIKVRKASYFGHVMRNEKYTILQLILQGTIESKRGPGRRRISWLKHLRQWTGMTSTTLFRSAVNKIIWSNVIANIQRG